MIRPFNTTTWALSSGLIAWGVLAPLSYAGRLRGIEYILLAAALLAYLALRINWRNAGAAAAAATAVLMVGCAGPSRTATSPRFQVAAYRAFAGDAAAVAEGQRLFVSRCAICHTPTDTSFIGPDLTFVAGRRPLRELEHHLRTSITGPRLSHRQVFDLVAYFAAKAERSTTP
jgi:mono/diheme cytochrome c family protein